MLGKRDCRGVDVIREATERGVNFVVEGIERGLVFLSSSFNCGRGEERGMARGKLQ